VNGGWTRNEQERPYPYDALIGGLPVMLSGGDKATPWHEEQAKFFDQLVAMTAEDRSYAQWPPDIEHPYAKTSWIEGMGASDQSEGTRRRYSHTFFADCSGGRPVKGPKVIDQTGITGTVVSSIVFNGNVIAAAGSKLYRRTSDSAGASWALITDVGATITGQMAVFKGIQANPFLFIPLGPSTNYKVLSVGDVLTQHASRHATHFEVVGNVLWLSSVESNQTIIRKTEDGGTAATWQGLTIIGDGSSAVTGLKCVADRLIVQKTVGPFAPSIESETIDEELAPDLRDGAEDDNGKISIAWNRRAVFNHGGGLLAYDTTDGSLTPIGLEILEGNRSPIRGTISSIAQHAGICLFATITTASGDTELLRYGSWELRGTDRGVARAFIPAWHGSLYTWTGKTVVDSLITSVYGAPRLYLFFDDASVAWCRLARTANVSDDPAYEFDAAHDGEICEPRWTDLFPFERKLLRGIGVGGRDMLSGTRTISSKYKLAEATDYTELGTVSTDPGDRINLESVAPGQAFDFCTVLSTGSATSSPMLTALVIYSSIRLGGLRVITALVRSGDDVLDHLGRPMPNSWLQTKQRLEAAMTAAGAITVVSPAGEEFSVIGLSYSHDYVGRDQTSKGQRWIESIRMVQSRAVASRGTWGRCEPYTWGDLALLTWGDLPSL
jgi:hypothetical protein